MAKLCNTFTELAEVDFGTEFAEETLGETEFLAANLGNKFTELVEVDFGTEFAEANLRVDIEMEFAAAKLYKFIELAEVTIGTEIFQS